MSNLVHVFPDYNLATILNFAILELMSSPLTVSLFNKSFLVLVHLGNQREGLLNVCCCCCCWYHLECQLIQH